MCCKLNFNLDVLPLLLQVGVLREKTVLIFSFISFIVPDYFNLVHKIVNAAVIYMNKAMNYTYNKHQLTMTANWIKLQISYLEANVIMSQNTADSNNCSFTLLQTYYCYLVWYPKIIKKIPYTLINHMFCSCNFHTFADATSDKREVFRGSYKVWTIKRRQAERKAWHWWYVATVSIYVACTCSWLILGFFLVWLLQAIMLIVYIRFKSVPRSNRY